MRAVYTSGDMRSETQRGLANSPSAFAGSYIINAYSALHYSGQSEREVPYFTAAPTLLSLFLSLSLLLCVSSTKLWGNHQNERKSSVISGTKIIKKNHKKEENDSEINFTFFLNANTNYALLQNFHKHGVTLTSFYGTNTSKKIMNVN